MKRLNIIKIGGNVINESAQLNAFLQVFARIPGKKILVHGGGKIASAMAEKLGVETKMIEGRRVTDAEMLKVVTMVYGGLVNKQIVSKLQAFGCNELGLTGADANIIPATKRRGWQHDYGFAGDIETINCEPLIRFVDAHLTPVIAPLTHDQQGNMLNTNADTIAATVAAALSASFEINLTYCFEKKGVLSDPGNDDAVMPKITLLSYEKMKDSGSVSAGMIPKLDNAFYALKSGVKSVRICRDTDIADDLSGVGTLLQL